MMGILLLALVGGLLIMVGASERVRTTGAMAVMAAAVLNFPAGMTVTDPAPEMIELPAGTFSMGSPADEKGRHANEGPQHAVTVAAFAIGRFELTADQWEICVRDGGCAPRPDGHIRYDPPGSDDPVEDRGRGAVIVVPWEDAQDYVAWLSEVTGETYRLPSEAEWEYAARAGTMTRYSWGDDEPPPGQVSYRVVGAAIEVGAYAPNPWGIHDMHGNVWEWVEDCWHDSYDGAPTDGSAWRSDDCNRRVLRGGVAPYSPDIVRSAHRDWSFVSMPAGIRVAKTISPIHAARSGGGD